MRWGSPLIVSTAIGPPVNSGRCRPGGASAAAGHAMNPMMKHSAGCSVQRIGKPANRQSVNRGHPPNATTGHGESCPTMPNPMLAHA